jgi:TonB-dependent receptor
MINRFLFTSCLALLLAFQWGSALAQPFTIRGLVVDRESGEPVIGAAVSLLPGTRGTLTDLDGKFFLGEIQEREVVVVVHMLGYTPLTRECSFLTDTSAKMLRLALVPEKTMLAQVEVTGKAEGQIKAMIDQQRSETIKNVVSAEQISTFPDMNAAEVMQRIPGITLQRDQGEGRYVQIRGTPPQLTNFNINGEQIPSPEGGVRFVGMDIIPSDQIDVIEVTKVMTPDMDADGIGGSVNVKTREADDEKPDIRAILSAGYGNLRQTPNYQAQFSFGQRTGRFGFQLNASYYENRQGADNIEYDFAKGPFFGSQDSAENNYFVQIRETQFRHYELTRTRISIAPSFDYRFSARSRIYLRAMYNRFSDDELRRRKIYALDDALSYTYYLYGSILHDSRDRLKVQELSTAGIGGEHPIGRMTLDYQLFVALAREDQPDRFETSFDNPGKAIGISFDLTDPEYPVIEIPNEADSLNAVDYAHYSLDEMLFEDRAVKDLNITPRINLSIPFSVGGNGDGYLKFGAKLRAKDKERSVESLAYGAYFEQAPGYPGLGPPLSVETVNDGFIDSDLLNAGYVISNMPSPDLMRDFYEFYPQHFVIDRTASKVESFGEDYTARERIYAGYGMIRQDFDRLMLLAGLRYEQTDISYQGYDVVTDGNRFIRLDTLRDERTHAFLLPQVQARYALNERVNFRGSVAMSYSRPNFDDVLPYREQDRDEVKYGNPDLAYPTSLNVDLLAERYYGKGILAAGVFYKAIDDFIFFFKRFAHEGDPKDYGLVEITKAVNGNIAHVFGAELQVQSKFNFFTSWLRDFGLYANYTYTYSDAVINKRFPANFTDAVVDFEDDDLEIYFNSGEVEHIRLPGQARHTANVALFYDTNRFFARLTANFHDAFLHQLGADADLDVYYDKEFRLDFTANYDLTPHLKVFADVINITNTPLRYYLGETWRVQQQEFYSWWCRTGIKLTF